MKLIRVWRHKFGGRPARTMAVVFTPLIALAKTAVCVSWPLFCIIYACACREGLKSDLKGSQESGGIILLRIALHCLS